ncbi:MAG: 2-oxoacid:acceptor oxidoreductase family protein [Planctomycetes bacterium]|nr:2-oxoacid:acceptor oxidoreductase family protein [Planctomycetota bacterium]
MNIRFAGFGGQGIVMAGYVLGYAGVLDGANALQTQSYGSESRGGACKSDVILSDGEILDLAPSDTDVLVAMSQPALEKYIANLKETGSLIYDSALVNPGDFKGTAFGVPATDLAHNTFGRDVVANVIMLGCLAGLTKCVSHDSLGRAIEENVPPPTRDMNIEAFKAGFRRGSDPGDLDKKK